MSRPSVWVTRPLPQAALDLLAGEVALEVWPDELPPPRAVVLEKVRDRDGLLPLLTDRIDAEVMDAAGPQLRVIANYAVGFDNLDVPAATARGIWVCNTPDVLTETTADLAWSLLMAAARRIGEGERYARAGRWQTWGPLLLLGHDVHGKTLGLLGCGRIGQAMARRAVGFRMRVLYLDSTARPAIERDCGATRVGFETLLRESDFLSIHCPLTPQTRGMMNAAAFAKMKPGSILVNSARGPVVDQAALIDALRSGTIAGAGLDVTDPEPPAPDDPILGLDNLVIVPHLGSASIETRTAMGLLAARNILLVLRGERPETPINEVG